MHEAASLSGVLNRTLSWQETLGLVGLSPTSQTSQSNSVGD